MRRVLRARTGGGIEDQRGHVLPRVRLPRGDEGRAELLKELLEERFGPLSKSAKTKIDKASSEALKRYGLKILTAENLLITSLVSVYLNCFIG